MSKKRTEVWARQTKSTTLTEADLEKLKSLAGARVLQAVVPTVVNFDDDKQASVTDEPESEIAGPVPAGKPSIVVAEKPANEKPANEEANGKA